jgi:hypothetical protein
MVCDSSVLGDALVVQGTDYILRTGCPRSAIVDSINHRPHYHEADRVQRYPICINGPVIHLFVRIPDTAAQGARTLKQLSFDEVVIDLRGADSSWVQIRLS